MRIFQIMKSIRKCFQKDGEVKMANYIVANDGLIDVDRLQHYGVLGMKWGHRRYQNKDGSLTNAGKKRYAGSSDNRPKKNNAKKIAATIIAGTAVGTAGVVYAKNRKAINSVITKFGSNTVSGLKKAKGNAAKAGKTFVKEATSGFKEGVKEGVKDAPKKVAKIVVTGVTLNAAKRLMDATIGKDETTRIFQANNNKKVSSFWKVSNDNRDKDED